MIRVLLKKLLEQGRIRKQAGGFIQVEGLLRDALIDLLEAKKSLYVSERGAYLLSYNAMLKAGRSLLLLEGYVPDDGAQHKTVIEVSGLILGEKFKNAVRKFDHMRHKRNGLTYEPGVLLSTRDAENALEEANFFLAGIFEKVKSRNPQFELKLKT